MTIHTLSEKQQFWLSQLQSCEASGCSMKSYAAEHSLNLQTLYYWKKQLIKLGLIDGNTPSLFVKAVRGQETAASGIHIRFANGVTVDVQHDFDRNRTVSPTLYSYLIPRYSIPKFVV